jgi:hypothetical protein
MRQTIGLGHCFYKRHGLQPSLHILLERIGVRDEWAIVSGLELSRRCRRVGGQAPSETLSLTVLRPKVPGQGTVDKKDRLSSVRCDETQRDCEAVLSLTPTS